MGAWAGGAATVESGARVWVLESVTSSTGAVLGPADGAVWPLEPAPPAAEAEKDAESGPDVCRFGTGSDILQQAADWG